VKENKKKDGKRLTGYTKPVKFKNMKTETTYRKKGNYYGKWYFVDNTITNGSKLREMDISLQINLDALTIVGCFIGTLNLFG
jgi:hypothetical protein